VDRATVGGDYFSPLDGVVGGTTYCVKAAIRWISGAAPFVGIEPYVGGVSQGVHWLIGSPFHDALGPTTVVNPTETGWQQLEHSVEMPAGVTQVRLVDELWEGGSKGGSPLAYFDGLSIDPGECTSTTRSIPYEERWETGTGGWIDLAYAPPTLTTDASSPSGPTVQELARSTTGGDCFSPEIGGVTGGQTYCVHANIKWTSGSQPFVGLDSLVDGVWQGATWLIGDAMFGAVQVSNTELGWQSLSSTVVLPAGTTRVRLVDELYAGNAKGGADLVYFDGLSLGSGPCTGLPYSENWESGADGWTDMRGLAPALVADATSRAGSLVQQVTRPAAGGDYMSPVVGVTGGQQYCVQANIRWTSGSEPFVGVNLIANGVSQGVQWVIGDAQFDATPVNRTETGWQPLRGTVALPTNVSAVRLVDELWAGGAKGGSDLAYFDGLSLTSGACAGVALPYLQNWELGTGGWADMGGLAPTLGADASSPSGSAVQDLSRTGSGGDYFSPVIDVTEGHNYCVKAAIKWTSGGAPFVGIQPIVAGTSQGAYWLIGSPFSDVLGPTTVVNPTQSGWQHLEHSVLMPAGITQVRLVDELWEGGSKGGSPQAHFDGLSIVEGECSVNPCANPESTAPCPDDSNPCTNDLCSAGACTHPNNTAACDDGNACTAGDTCAVGTCAGTPVSCDDSNPCTNDTCNAGACQHANNTAACDDGNACTAGDTCAAGTCAGTPVSCDDSNPCTNDTCNAGACQHANNTFSCDDGDPCTSADSCSGGVCSGTLGGEVQVTFTTHGPPSTPASAPNEIYLSRAAPLGDVVLERVAPLTWSAIATVPQLSTFDYYYRRTASETTAEVGPWGEVIAPRPFSVECRDISIEDTVWNWDDLVPTGTPAPLDKGPTVSPVGDTRTEATITLDLAAAQIVTLHYSTESNVYPPENIVTHAAATHHDLSLTGLTPGTTYYYYLELGAQITTEYRWTTSPGAGQPFRFVALGDTQDRNGSVYNHEMHRNIVRQAYAYHPNLVIRTGDEVDVRTDMSLWNYLFAIQRPLLGNALYFTATGNHDYVASSPTTYYFDLFTLPPGPTQQYYAVKYGNTLFIALSTETTITGTQTTWLSSTLTAANADPEIYWRVVFFHQPIYTNGLHAANTTARNAWHSLFENNGVDLVFSGHNHSYEHALVNGVHYLVVGGGSDLYAVGANTWGLISASVNHFGVVDVDGHALTANVYCNEGNLSACCADSGRLDRVWLGPHESCVTATDCLGLGDQPGSGAWTCSNGRCEWY
jgi:predicted MPP superfamily phosphohydrolase